MTKKRNKLKRQLQDQLKKRKINITEAVAENPTDSIETESCDIDDVAGPEVLINESDSVDVKMMVNGDKKASTSDVAIEGVASDDIENLEGEISEIEVGVVTDENLANETSEEEPDNVSPQNMLSDEDAQVAQNMLGVMTGSVKTPVKQPRFYKKVWFWLVLMVLVGGGFGYYKSQTYQNITINNREYSSKNLADEIVGELYAQLKNQTIVFKNTTKTAEISLGDAGISFDAEKLTHDIYAAREFRLANLFFKQPLVIKMMIDYPILQNALNQQFSDELVNVKNAQIAYNREANKFLVTEAVTGYQVDARTVLPSAEDLEFGYQKTINVKYQTTEPIITTAMAQQMATELNEKIRLRINLNHNGKLLYFADPWDIAGWYDIVPDETQRKIIATLNQQRIQDFIEKTVAPQIQRGVVNQKTLVNADGKVVQVLQPGVRGLGAVNPQNSAEKILIAVNKNQNLDLDLDIQEIDFKEERILLDGHKWISVNLSRQTTTLHIGDQALQTFVISSGVSPWLTPTGTFYVWHKNPKQVMTGGSREVGDYYYLPNVKWNTYFTHSGVGFHTAYWHNNFGRPMSHGCVNMREADAKIVYDFAPIGTRVVVHY